ncbi:MULTISPECIES: hypothetical protein [unclassified Streptomyces]|uniref:hypothetical protein n=1 Tax=unclassified Streptomyces TaxID=2593676 RepID=UPI002E165A08|nr:hypothetical protein OG452_31670 [Streptomyces sp. NBC_01197]WSS47726.1 hypothetical protein OG708_03195 [Streptomyces sp. NBC_01180]
MSSAHAADAAGRAGSKLNPIGELDAVATSGIPAPYAARLPKVKDQLAGVNHLNELNQLHQLTDQAAPVLSLVSAVE